ncbi:MAG: polar amino acid transport system substrate-binding protein, partial [Actinomycetota bacterium]|nr:polar amino acid transport system substrate-binding protein [Actinomycetota bacterium]
VLKQVAGALTRTATDATVIGRWGGEEFLVVVQVADVAKVQALAELLRRAVATVVLPDARAVTASFGVAIHRPGETTSELVGRADNALYDAKRSGRNQVALA